VRRWLLAALNTELGVLGEQVEQIREQVLALGESHSALQERFTRFQNKSGMRWARSGANADSEIQALLADALKKRPNPDFDL